MNKRRIQIAIDGYAGCGKSTLAKKIADYFGLVYIPSGDLYRYVTLKMLEADIAPLAITEKDLVFLNQLCSANVHSIMEEERIFDQLEVKSKEIRQKVGLYAQMPIVRNSINDFIRSTKKSFSSIVEGRDIGSLVLPDADLKYFMYGSIDYRISCWEKGQIAQKGFFDQSERDSLYRDTLARDRMDETRAIAPLICAKDAIKIDVEQLHGEKLFQKVVKDIKKIYK